MSLEDEFAGLRRRAQEMMQGYEPIDPDILSTDELQNIVHELQVHRIELELQNQELRQAQSTLEESREKYIDLYDFAPVGYFTFNQDELIQEVNLTGAAMLGVERSQLVGRHLGEFIQPDDRDILYLHFRRLANTQEPQQCEIEVSKPDESKAYFRLDSVANNLHFRTTMTDVTARRQAQDTLRESNEHLAKTLVELKQTQQKILQQERLAAVGQLAAGIAHDFNNILTGIIGFASLLQQSPDTPEPVRADLARITTMGERAAHLVRQILDFSRKSIQQPRQFDLAAFIKEALKFWERTIPEHIHLSLHIEPGEYMLKADPLQIQQALTNLVVNARDAMPGGGELRVELARAVLQGQVTCGDCFKPIVGEWLCLTVSDSGTGIPPEVIPHIFEPFFTTKAVGEGSGLGLSQVLGIIQQHTGHIRLISRVGQGSSFTLYLPPAPSTQPAGEPRSTGPIARGHGEVILLVEDDPIVLQVHEAMLQHLGYRALIAKNGREALTVYVAHQDEIALVLSDMVMPDMEGVALLANLKEHDPTIKVVIMSGYPLEEREAGLLAQGVVDWFQKPISIEELARVVSQTLSG